MNAYVYPIHRLDRGALRHRLFALDKDAARAFSDACPRPTSATSRSRAAIHPTTSCSITAIPKAPGEARVDATTELWRRETFGRYALVEARPHTGRLHQIRRHLKHLACPLIGDVRYGKGEHNRIFREQHGLHRLALHCISLTVPHPDGTTLAVTCELAPDLVLAIASARAAYAAAAAP